MAEPMPLRYTIETTEWQLEIRGCREPTAQELERWQTLAWAVFGPDAELTAVPQAPPPSTGPVGVDQ